MVAKKYRKQHQHPRGGWRMARENKSGISSEIGGGDKQA